MIRKKSKSYNSNTSFLDILFNTLVGFVLLFIIAFLLISPVKKKKEIEQKAEYVITITWPGDMSDDVDSWLEDPTGKVMYFRKREAGLMHLDRDDLGSLNDTILVPGIGLVNYPFLPDTVKDPNDTRDMEYDKVLICEDVQSYI